MACAHFMFSARPRGVPRGHAALQGHIAGDEVRKRAGNAALCGEGRFISCSSRSTPKDIENRIDVSRGPAGHERYYLMRIRTKSAGTDQPPSAKFPAGYNFLRRRRGNMVQPQSEPEGSERRRRRPGQRYPRVVLGVRGPRGGEPIRHTRLPPCKASRMDEHSTLLSARANPVPSAGLFAPAAKEQGAIVVHSFGEFRFPCE
jgi:hypothetical protein